MAIFPRANPGAGRQSSGHYPRYDRIKSSSIYNWEYHILIIQGRQSIL